MPTQPFKQILNRNMSEVLLRPIIEVASPALQEAVNYATNAYERCRASEKGTLKEAVPVLASYLHVIQMTDSIEVLISNGCASPAHLLLRSSFEGKLSIEYILEKESAKRAMAWLVKEILDMIESYGKFVSISDQPDSQLQPPPSDMIEEINRQINNLRATLNRPDYADIYSEYQNLKRRSRRTPEWYSLFSGPRNLRELSEHLDQVPEYEVLYRSWSRLSHAGGTSHISLPLEDGTVFLGKIRNPLPLVNISGQALTFLLDATLAFIKEYRPAELTSFWKWHDKELKGLHVELIRLELGELDWSYKKFVGPP